MKSTKYIADMARHHDIYRFVSDDIQPSERLVQKYRREYRCYFEVLVQMTLKKKASDFELTDFNRIAIDGTIKKVYNSNTMSSPKKETKYYLITSTDWQLVRKSLIKCIKSLNMENIDIHMEDKIKLLYDIETKFTFAG